MEYTVIPAPTRGEKIRGARTAPDRYAATLTDTLNRMAAEGWEYVRAETLPSEEKSGIASRTTVWMNVLVFRRPLAVEVAPVVAAAPVVKVETPAPLPAAAPIASPAPAVALAAAARDTEDGEAPMRLSTPAP